ncbi:hypothetical protein PG616_11850 [Riemerella anatipestifer]|nr:hypothetical protein [Riemerella anatipestifer]
MKLQFTTKINGKPTFFAEKIILSLYRFKIISEIGAFNAMIDYYKSKNDGLAYEGGFPKIHTIRKDKSNLWEKGEFIDFFIDDFRFAPSVIVKSVQPIKMFYASDNIIEITIDGRLITDFKEKEQLAINDGFNSYKDFFDYFYPIIKEIPNNLFIGKIIHWTDFKY